jgi:hypothetical protein
MADVQDFLTRKLGPLPVWAWAGVGGGLVAVLYLRGQGQSVSAPPAGAPGTDGSGQGLFAPSPIIVTPSTMPSSTSSANAPAPGPAIPGPIQIGSVVSTNGGLLVRPGGQAGNWTTDGNVPIGTRLTVIGPPVPALWQNQPFLATPVQFEGRATWANANDLVPATGMGGSSAVLRTLPGAGKVGRFTSRHAHPQFLSVGGMGGGRAGLKAVSKRTGLPEIRLMSLNPGHWRSTPGGVPRHIHIR